MITDRIGLHSVLLPLYKGKYLNSEVSLKMRTDRMARDIFFSGSRDAEKLTDKMQLSIVLVQAIH